MLDAYLESFRLPARIVRQGIVRQVTPRGGPEVVVQLVHERLPRGILELRDLVVADAVEVFDQRPQAVAMSDDEHALALTQRRGNVALPVRHEAVERVLQRLRTGHLATGQRGVPTIATRPERVIHRQRGRSRRVAPAPELDLRLTIPLGRLPLVQTLQGAIHSLVQAPAALNGEPHRIELLEHDP